MRLRVRLNDSPGPLARLTGLVAGSGANAVDVVHTRNTLNTHIGEAELQLLIETKGATHLTQVLAQLSDERFAPQVLS